MKILKKKAYQKFSIRVIKKHGYDIYDIGEMQILFAWIRSC